MTGIINLVRAACIIEHDLSDIYLVKRFRKE